MNQYAEFFLSSKSSVVQLELLELSHPSFSKTYRIVRNAAQGVTVTLENGDVEFFQYYPANIEGVGVRDDLDFGLSVQLGDLGEIIPQELDRVTNEGTFNILPDLIYRTYRSDDLENILFGPIRLSARNFSFREEGATFIANAPALNSTKTGKLYTFEDFPMLRGFV